jgi:hypothetical protein
VTKPADQTLERWCLLANAAAHDIEGVRNTCILTSHALVAFLRMQGLEAEVFRAEAAIHCCRHDVVLVCVGGHRRPDGLVEPGEHNTAPLTSATSRRISRV